MEWKMDIKDRLEEMVVELEYIDSVLNCIYDGYFMCASEQDINLERYGNMTALSIKLLEQQKEELNQVVESLYKKRYDYGK